MKQLGAKRDWGSHLGAQRRLRYGAGWALAAALWLGLASPLWAAEGDSRGGLFIGTTSFAVGGDTTFGTTFGFNYGTEIEDDLLWSTSAAFISTEGEKVVDGQTFPISTRATIVQTGLLAFFNLGPGSTLLPFVGGGPSLISYDIDHTYPGSQVGRTSGTGFGFFGTTGVEIRLGKRTTLIPQYLFTAHTIETETGNSTTLFSGGLMIAFRIRA